jgi:hypothetical protein
VKRHFNRRRELCAAGCEAGVRTSTHIPLSYLNAWLHGLGTVAILATSCAMCFGYGKSVRNFRFDLI